MRQQPKHRRFARPSLADATRWLVVVAAIVTAALLGWLDAADRVVALPLAFKLRAALGRAPVISPHLKVILIDDLTIDSLHALEMSDAEWHDVLAFLARRHVGAVLIDKAFFAPTRARDASTMVDAIPSDLPIVTGLLPVLYGRGERKPFARPAYRVSVPSAWDAQPPEAADRRQFTYYGAYELAAPVLRRAGHIDNAAGGYTTAAALTRSAGWIPHAGIIAATLAQASATS